MHSTPQSFPPSPDFANLRRRTAIDWLLSIRINPFQAFRNPKSGNAEDFYIHIMNDMPRLLAETDWEVANFKRRNNDLAARIATARHRR